MVPNEGRSKSGGADTVRFACTRVAPFLFFCIAERARLAISVLEAAASRLAVNTSNEFTTVAKQLSQMMHNLDHQS